jgi:hypothetical protein
MHDTRVKVRISAKDAQRKFVLDYLKTVSIADAEGNTLC